MYEYVYVCICIDQHPFAIHHQDSCIHTSHRCENSRSDELLFDVDSAATEHFPSAREHYTDCINEG